MLNNLIEKTNIGASKLILIKQKTDLCILLDCPNDILNLSGYVASFIYWKTRFGFGVFIAIEVKCASRELSVDQWRRVGVASRQWLFAHVGDGFT